MRFSQNSPLDSWIDCRCCSCTDPDAPRQSRWDGRAAEGRCGLKQWRGFRYFEVECEVCWHSSEETAFLTNYRETFYLYPIVKLVSNLADAQSDIFQWLHFSKYTQLNIYENGWLTTRLPSISIQRTAAQKGERRQLEIWSVPSTSRGWHLTVAGPWLGAISARPGVGGIGVGLVCANWFAKCIHNSFAPGRVSLSFIHD